MHMNCTPEQAINAEVLLLLLLFFLIIKRTLFINFKKKKKRYRSAKIKMEKKKSDTKLTTMAIEPKKQKMDTISVM